MEQKEMASKYCPISQSKCLLDICVHYESKTRLVDQIHTYEKAEITIGSCKLWPRREIE